MSAVSTEVKEQTGMVAMIERLALSPDVDVAKLEKLLELQERILNRNAEAAFNDAMRLVQAEMPKIKRNKKNNQTGSLYADLEAVTNQAVPIYTKHGFSLSFSQTDCPIDGKMRVICYCSNSGYTRQYQYDASLDMTGLKGAANKTPIQGEGSTFSYAQRYLTKLIFNITLTDEDNDGQGDIEFINESQINDLMALAEEVKANREKFLQYMGVEKLADIQVSQFKKAVAALEQKRKSA